MKTINENYFKNSNDTSSKTIEDYINKDEPILWSGKPNKKAFILSSVLKMLPIALIWGFFDGYMIYQISNYIKDIPTPFLIFFIVFFVIHLTPVWLWLSKLITSSIEYKNIEYAFTNKRIIIKSGVVGIDFKNIFYTEIGSVNLRVGLADKLLRVGDIYINCKNQAIVLNDISDPYFLTEKLQSIVIDIKTDIEFPNDLRPHTNKGYRSSLKTSDITDLNKFNDNK